MTLKARTLWTTLGAVMVLALTLSFVTTSAQVPGGRRGNGPAMSQRPGGPGGRGLAPFLRGLDLTDTQRDQIRSIMEARRPGAGMEKGAELNRELQSAIFADSPDQTKIEQLKTALAEQHAAELSARIESELKIAQVLTAEQRAKVRDLPPGPRGRGGRRF